METQSVPPSTQSTDALLWLDRIGKFLDNQFRIPGTQIRFGLDFLIGLIPYVGDVSGFIIGAVLVLIMTRYKAGGRVMLKMVGNIWLDGLVGTVPILGDIFDLRYKANVRNINLLKQYYQEGKHHGSAWGAVLLISLVSIALIISSVWAMFWIVNQVLVWLTQGISAWG